MVKAFSSLEISLASAGWRPARWHVSGGDLPHDLSIARRMERPFIDHAPVLFASLIQAFAAGNSDSPNSRTSP
jgi:hypothetical protein